MSLEQDGGGAVMDPKSLLGELEIWFDDELASFEARQSMSMEESQWGKQYTFRVQRKLEDLRFKWLGDCRRVSVKEMERTG